MVRHCPGSLPGGQGHFLTLARFPSRRGRAIFGHYPGSLPGGPGHFLDLGNPCAPPCLASFGRHCPPSLRVPEPTICFCQAVEMPSGRQKSIKLGKNRFLDPFLGEGPFRSQKGLPDSIRRRVERSLLKQGVGSQKIVKGGGGGGGGRGGGFRVLIFISRDKI